MKCLFLVTVIVAASVKANVFSEIVDSAWASFKAEYGKVYGSLQEETARKNNFMENYNAIIEHNNLYEQSLVKYRLKINQYADMSREEMGRAPEEFGEDEKLKDYKVLMFVPNMSIPIPDTFDWRDKRAVTDVKNQGGCRAGWAFSAVGALEAQYFLKSGHLVPLSAQNAVDCASNASSLGYSTGCGGATPLAVHFYVNHNDGIDSEMYYPYEGLNTTCRYDDAYNVTSTNGFQLVEPGNEDHLMRAVATAGPVSVLVDARNATFTFYSGGIYYEPACSVNSINHGVLVVGYGSEGGEDYWLVKNSYGRESGESGYMRIVRNRDSHCGIAARSTIPLNY